MNTSSCLLHLEGGGVPGLQASPLLVHLVLKRECMPGKHSPNKATASAPNPSLPYWSLYPVLQGCFSPLPHLLLCPCPPWPSITSQFPLPEIQSSLRSETLNLLCLHSRHLKATLNSYDYARPSCSAGTSASHIQLQSLPLQTCLLSCSFLCTFLEFVVCSLASVTAVTQERIHFEQSFVPFLELQQYLTSNIRHMRACETDECVNL